MDEDQPLRRPAKTWSSRVTFWHVDDACGDYSTWIEIRTVLIALNVLVGVFVKAGLALQQ
jgi:hypothetical protein